MVKGPSSGLSKFTVNTAHVDDVNILWKCYDYDGDITDKVFDEGFNLSITISKKYFQVLWLVGFTLPLLN